ncbi:uncharacterized protein LOC144863906 [Branchiostoma floridae x Branchiostoma japonicum]
MDAAGGGNEPRRPPGPAHDYGPYKKLLLGIFEDMDNAQYKAFKQHLDCVVSRDNVSIPKYRVQRAKRQDMPDLILRYIQRREALDVVARILRDLPNVQLLERIRHFTHPEPGSRGSVLLVSTEYGTSKGGISTINRQVAHKFTTSGAEVHATVLEASPQDERDAERDGVRLLKPRLDPDSSAKPSLEWLTVYHSIHFPHIPSDVRCVVGHVDVTSRAARKIKEERFPHAKLAMFGHVAPEETEHYKSDEKALGVGRKEASIQDDIGEADVVFSVGPRIHRHYDRFLSQHHVTHHIFLPEPSKVFREANVTFSEEGEVRKPERVVLSIGTVRNVERLKGHDLAAGSIDKAAQRLDNQYTLRLRVRGIDKNDFKESKRILEEKLRSGRVRPTLLPYGTQEEIRRDMEACHLVLMPSRAEPFGLVGLEAIAAGVPVLISEHSGVAELIEELSDRLGQPNFRHCIVKMKGDTATDTEKWAERIEDVLNNAKSEFAEARAFREKLLASKYWEESHQTFLQACGITAAGYIVMQIKHAAVSEEDYQRTCEDIAAVLDRCSPGQGNLILDEVRRRDCVLVKYLLYTKELAWKRPKDIIETMSTDGCKEELRHLGVIYINVEDETLFTGELHMDPSTWDPVEVTQWVTRTLLPRDPTATIPDLQLTGAEICIRPETWFTDKFPAGQGRVLYSDLQQRRDDTAKNCQRSFGGREEEHKRVVEGSSATFLASAYLMSMILILLGVEQHRERAEHILQYLQSLTEVTKRRSKRKKAIQCGHFNHSWAKENIIKEISSLPSTEASVAFGSRAIAISCEAYSQAATSVDEAMKVIGAPLEIKINEPWWDWRRGIRVGGAVVGGAVGGAVGAAVGGAVGAAAAGGAFVAAAVGAAVVVGAVVGGAGVGGGVVVAAEAGAAAAGGTVVTKAAVYGAAVVGAAVGRAAVVGAAAGGTFVAAAAVGRAAVGGTVVLAAVVAVAAVCAVCMANFKANYSQALILLLKVLRERDMTKQKLQEIIARAQTESKRCSIRDVESKMMEILPSVSKLGPRIPPSRIQEEAGFDYRAKAWLTNNSIRKINDTITIAYAQYQLRHLLRDVFVLGVVGSKNSGKNMIVKSVFPKGERSSHQTRSCPYDVMLYDGSNDLGDGTLPVLLFPSGQGKVVDEAHGLCTGVCGAFICEVECGSPDISALARVEGLHVPVLLCVNKCGSVKDQQEASQILDRYKAQVSSKFRSLKDLTEVVVTDFQTTHRPAWLTGAEGVKYWVRDAIQNHKRYVSNVEAEFEHVLPLGEPYHEHVKEPATLIKKRPFPE